MPESRPVSGLEVKWLAAHSIGPHFAIDFVVCLDGALPISTWNNAWNIVVAAHPGLQVRIRGHLGRRRWVSDGSPPPVRAVDHPGWDARVALPADAGGVRLDAENGPVACLLVVPGATPGTQTIVVRALHAITDGRGGIAVLDDLFRALRGEPLGGPYFVDMTDADVSRSAGGKASPRQMPTFAPLARGPAAHHDGRWVRVTLQRPPRRVYAEVVWALARWCGQTPLRVSLPVDLRRHAPHLPATVANLSGIVLLDLDGASRAPDPPAAIHAALHDAVGAGAHHGPVLEADPMRNWPLGITSKMGGILSARDQRHRSVPTSATLSNLGRIDVSQWRLGSVSTTATFIGPPASPGLPLLAVMVGHHNVIEVAGAVPPSWGAADGWAQALVATFGAA